MYRVACEVLPRATSPDYGHIDWAVADVFVDRPQASQAEAAARQLIDGQGWDIEDVLFIREARLAEIDEGIPARAAFEQALREGIAVVYHKVSPGLPPGAASPLGDSILRILAAYHERRLSPDQAARAFLDEMERAPLSLNLQIDPPLL